MTTSPASIVDADHAAFITGGVSMSVGACGSDLLPALVRGTGCRVSDDCCKVTVFVSATQAAKVLKCVRETAAIAVVFSRPSTHRTVQLKGRDAVVQGLAGDDLEIVAAYRDAFARELAPLGFDPALVRMLLALPAAELVGLSFTVSEAYSQTPGPRAGEPLKAHA